MQTLAGTALLTGHTGPLSSVAFRKDSQHLVSCGSDLSVKLWKLEGDGGNKEVSSRVQAVCDFFGPTDLTKMGEHTTIKGPIDHDSPNAMYAKAGLDAKGITAKVFEALGKDAAQAKFKLA